jgi:hypothetical protein
VSADALRAFDQWREVGPVRIVDRCGHGHDQEFGRGQDGRIGRVREVGGGTHFIAAHFAGWVHEALVGRDLFGREIEAERAVLLAELDRQRQAHVAEADDGNRGRIGVSHGVSSVKVESRRPVGVEPRGITRQQARGDSSGAVSAGWRMRPAPAVPDRA